MWSDLTLSLLLKGTHICVLLVQQDICVVYRGLQCKPTCVILVVSLWHKYPVKMIGCFLRYYLWNVRTGAFSFSGVYNMY